MTTQDQANLLKITGVVAPTPILKVFDTPTTNSSSISYIGIAPFGSITSDPVWTIYAITSNCTLATSGGAIVISNIGTGTQSIISQLLSGAIWDNRVSLTYKY